MEAPHILQDSELEALYNDTNFKVPYQVQRYNILIMGFRTGIVTFFLILHGLMFLVFQVTAQIRLPLCKWTPSSGEPWMVGVGYGLIWAQ